MQSKKDSPVTEHPIFKKMLNGDPSWKDDFEKL
jgi:hypothetical protein